MNTTINVKVNFAAFEARARMLAKVGDYESSGMMLQLLEIVRELAPKPAPPAAAESTPEAPSA